MISGSAGLLLLSILFAAPPHAVAENAPQGDPPALVVALGSSLSDVGTAASLVAAGKGDAVVFAESADRLGNANVRLVREQMPERVYIVGGSRAVGAGVESQLKSLVPDASIQRFAGSTRVETAALAADEALSGRSASRIIVANGWSLPDVGAAAAAVAAGAADAVLYAERGNLGEETRETLGEHQPATVLIAGGRAALSAEVEADAATAAGGATTTRLGGATRLETAARIAQEALPGGAGTVVVADGWSLSDVGVAASLSASLPDSVVLYSSDGDDLPGVLDAALRGLALDRIVLVDGSSAASRGILNGLARRGTLTRIASAVDATRAALGEDVGERLEVEVTDLAAAIAGAEAYMVELVNELRESVGVPPLHQNALIADVARNWSDSMQERNALEHNPNYASEYPPGSDLSGENIATVPCLDCPEGLRNATRRAFDGLVDSPPHYENMTRPGFGQIGVGIALPVGGGPRVIRVTQNFACYTTQPLQSNETCPAGPGPVRTGTELSGEDRRAVAGFEAPYSVSSVRDGTYLAMDYSEVDPNGLGGGMCAIRSDNSIMCWNGLSKAFQRNVPSGEFKDIAVGGEGVCALRLDGVIECWGNAGSPAELLSPPGGAHQAITVGERHACALRTDRTIVCWGSAVMGSGPDGPWNDDANLRPPGGTYTSVSAGSWHACALSTNRSIRCWGRNTAGQTNAPAGEFSAVSVGGHHTCAIRADGTVHCWGHFLNGEMQFDFGDNRRHDLASIAVGDDSVCVMDSNSDLACRHAKRAQPVGTTGLIPADGSSFDVSVPDGPFVSISVGSRTGCGLRPNGAIACWGRGVDGLHVPPGDYQALSNGCGLRQDGTMLCWKDLPAVDQPWAIWGWPSRGGVAVFPGKYTAFSSGPIGGGWTGSSHVCGVATDSVINCFGLDFATGNALRRGLRIEGSYRSVVVGRGAACALRTDAEIFCWGEENARQFGMLDPPSGSYTQLTAGHAHSCAIRSDQTVTCWGDNSAGQLDAPSGRFASISSSDHRTCGVRPDGSADCWGDWHGDPPGHDDDGPLTSITLDSGGGCYVGERVYGDDWDGEFGSYSPTFGCFGASSTWPLPWLPRDDQGMWTDWTYLDANSRCGIRSDGGITCWPELPGGVTWHTAESMIWTYGTDVEASGQWPW